MHADVQRKHDTSQGSPFKQLAGADGPLRKNTRHRAKGGKLRDVVTYEVNNATHSS